MEWIDERQQGENSIVYKRIIYKNAPVMNRGIYRYNIAVYTTPD